MRKVKLVKHLQLMDFLKTSIRKSLRKSHLSGRSRQKFVQNGLIALRDFELATLLLISGYVPKSYSALQCLQLRKYVM
jgi:DNA repair protein RadC